MIEIEMKCTLSPELLSKVREKVREMEYKGTVHNRDLYYDTPNWDLLRRAAFVRVRNDQHLEFKFNENSEQGHGQSTERTFSLQPDGAMAAKMNALFAHFVPTWSPSATVAEAIEQNHLIVLARIDNKREAYANPLIDLSIDHVAGLGDFLEVETRCEEDADTTEAQKILQTFIADLDVQHIQVGYVELWLRLHNPEAYEVGRYHL